MSSAAAVRHALRWGLLCTAAVVLGLLACRGLIGPAGRVGSDWQYLRFGGEELLGRHLPLAYGGIVTEGRAAGGLHTYASYPFLQIGPPALLIAAVTQWGPWHGLLLVAVLLALLGVGCAVLVERASGRDGAPPSLVPAAALTLVGWYQLARFHHVDDALVLTGMCLAALALRRSSAIGLGLALGLAASAKPWGAPLLVLALALPSWRGRLTAGTVAIATTVAAWLPFVLADPRTLSVGAVGLYVSPDSVLGALGVHHLARGTDIRVLQLLGGLVVAYVLVRRRLWWAAPLAVFAWRLGIDPATYPYYAAALVPAAHLLDRGSGRRFPWVTAVSAAAVMLLELPTGTASAVARSAVLGGLLLVALVDPQALGRGGRRFTSAVPSERRSRPTRGLPEVA